MARMVKCIKIGETLPAMDYPPFGGELGQRIWAEVSEEAWNGFLEHFKRIMNENRLEGGTELATRIFMEQAEAYFYGGDVQQAQGYVPEK